MFWHPWCRQYSHFYQTLKRLNGMTDIPLSSCWGSALAWPSLSAWQSLSKQKQTIHKAASLLKSIVRLLAWSAKEKQFDRFKFKQHFCQATLSDSCSGIKVTDISVLKFTSLSGGFELASTELLINDKSRNKTFSVTLYRKLINDRMASRAGV